MGNSSWKLSSLEGSHKRRSKRFLNGADAGSPESVRSDKKRAWTSPLTCGELASVQQDARRCRGENDLGTKRNALKKQRPIELLVCLLVVWAAGPRAQIGPLAGNWHRFRDEAHRVSFAYPAEMHPIIA